MFCVASTYLYLNEKGSNIFAALALHKHPETIVNMLFGSIDEEKGFYGVYLCV